MPSALVHGFEDAWASSDPTLLDAEVTELRVQGTGSLRLTVRAGAAGVTAAHTPAVPLDLSAFDELRVWTHSTRASEGGPRRPFLLELSYTDAGDAPGEEHRWFVPVSRTRVWEQHRFGIAGDRRGQVTELRWRVLTDVPFQIRLDELLAVEDRPLGDIEEALVGLLDAMPLPGVTGLPVQPAAAGSGTIVVTGLNRRLHAGNRVAVSGAERYTVLGAAHDEPGDTTTLTVQPALAAAIGPGTTISVVAPVVVEESPFDPPAEAADLPDPVVLVTLTDQREEPERGWNIAQRDSFRVRGGLTVCSVRPPARPVLAEYQILPAAGDRRNSTALRAEIMRRVGVDAGLRVNGTVLPVRTLLPPPLDIRVRATPAPVYLHIGTRVELGPRVEVPLAASPTLHSGPLSGPFDPADDEPPPIPGPDDQEGIVLRL
ncbi:hypothetical protein AB0I28_02890 [Phytomonospora sp. NPDC050363]|uniref:hypothetical protein n=1 Tax=Phytomonospora sp. NPDC050363 TaxID=3155642 RepID=UPI0033D5C68A